MPNRLAQAQSLYLRKHADNPVDWWPWCDQALATARQRNQPFFVCGPFQLSLVHSDGRGGVFADLLPTLLKQYTQTAVFTISAE